MEQRDAGKRRREAKMKEAKPTSVPTKAKQVGETHSRWGWVEPVVWTERMLTALEEGVKGGKWFSLMDKVYALPNLQRAFERVKANKGAAGVDHQTIEMFSIHLEENLETIARSLKEGTYQPKAIKRVWIPKPGTSEKRPLGIPAVQDRVVQTALRNVIEPIFEAEFAPSSYGFRPNRGCKDALRRVEELLREGQVWVVDADLKSYFDTIPHQELMERVEHRVADGRVLKLVESFLKQGIMEGMQSWTPEQGSPQGAVISPMLSNIYLNPLDHLMAEAGYEMIRYADDLVVMCKSKAQAEQAMGKVEKWTAEAGLKLHPEKTRIVDARQAGGFDFLGYHFERGYKWPRKKSLKKLRDTIRVKTNRTNGNSLKTIISQVNQTLKGWFEYFKHSHKTTFNDIDSWIRMRLRSVLRKRRGNKGRGRGQDHNRWPNAFFAEQGLFSLAKAYAQVCQSLRKVNC
jgi:RNA-directed DNA polymerase